jgi:SPW repeat
MPQSAFSFPKQWQDWTSWALGLWLLLSPWTLFFEHEARALENALVVGALIIVVEIVELSVFRDWEEWMNVGLGAWLAISPWTLGIASGAARWNFVIVGVLVLGLALYELREMQTAGSKAPEQPQ